eukprot:TRINITY_DN78492_c0_g1_i1.p1 TRINITY_DN78492_c0_g1~~TRINITY_DN78492_c0_g1_i1.p1  ORF type:complete len:679 (+),score=157.97 TRINITY_DN78492_c0_g1_i1:53-2089(+)
MAEIQHTPKNILITGAAGFIASHVAELLFFKYPQYKIVILDRMDYCANMKNFESMQGKPNFKFVKGDVKSPDLFGYILESEDIDTVMHFAAQTHVDNSFGNSVTFTEDNVLGTHTILEVLKANKERVKRYIHVSTDEVYGENSSYHDADDMKSENTSPLDPTNPYAASKAAAEMMVKSYHRSYGLPVIVTRGNNVYGPRQFPEKLIPKMIMMLSRGKKLTVHGEGLSKRSYLHVTDVANAFDMVLHKGTTGSTYNIGTSMEHSVISIVRRIIKMMRPDIDENSMIEFVRNRPFNDMRYYLDLKQLEALGWKEQIPFDEGLKQTVDWFKMHGDSFWGATDMDAVLVAHPSAPSTASDPVAVNSAAPPAKKSKTVKFLIFGKTGWIGGMLGDLLRKQGYEFEYATTRLENRESVEREILHSGCTHVLNAAGLTGRPNVDWCETHRPETIRVNVIGTLTLADICSAHGIHMTNFATGCIFHYEGNKVENPERNEHLVAKDPSLTFSEEDRPNFKGSYYSETKGYVENMLREFDHVLTLRVRMPIDGDVLCNKRNFIYKISHYEKVVNIPNSMTVLNELLPYAIELAIRKRCGIMNFCNPGAISHNQVLELYKEYIDPDFTWKNFTVDEQAKVIQAARSNNELSPHKLWKEFPGMLPIRDSLREFVFKPLQTEKSKAAMAKK